MHSTHSPGKCLLAKALFLGMSLAASLSPAQAQTAAPSPRLAQAKAAIALGHARWMQAWKTHDASLMAHLFLLDGAEMGRGGQVTRGRGAIEGHFAGLFAAVGPAVARLSPGDVWLVDATAYETGKYSYAFPARLPGGPPDVQAGRYVTLWQHQKDGEWLIKTNLTFPSE